MNNIKKTSSNGITLVSIVITIIILLILVSVSVSIIIDGDGLLSQSGLAVQSTKEEQKAEKSKTSSNSCTICR